MKLKIDWETCPKCGSEFIQQDRTTKELYCLVKSCNHKWNQLLKNIINPYLRSSTQ